ncbi:SH3 domain-containing kinase-binding protein 1 isoform X3 [Pleurodeles waltl]|uniref:SH3 domain-containing kinase-binding protein 1 isoform X3 n=1 Tax=Pleurodeles waltl TaxID=8319 RepID=UPI003709B6CC
MVDAIVEFDYKAQHDDELTITGGDIITNIKKEDGGWWEGELKGRRGLFPDNFVRELKKDSKKEILINKVPEKPAKEGPNGSIGHSAEAVIRVSRKGDRNRRRRCQVAFSYMPQNEDELELKVGEIIEVLGEVEEGWWEGILNGRSGMFPSNFIKEIAGDVDCVGMSLDEQQIKPGRRKDTGVKDATGSESDGGDSSSTKSDGANGTLTGERNQPKKIRGFGFGDIFKDRPIRLRPRSIEVDNEMLPPEKTIGRKLPPASSSQEPVKLEVDGRTKTKEYCKVLFPYEAQNEDELTIREGDTVLVINKVEATTLPPIQGPGHALKAGDWVVVKKHVRKSCLEPRWKGPFQVILTTTTAVKCAGVPNWIHASHTKKVLCPTDEEVEALKLPVPDKTVLSAETEQNRTESEQAGTEEREIFSEDEETNSLGEDQGESSDSDEAAEGDKEPEAAEGSKEPEAAEGDKEPEAAESDKEPEESNGDEGLEKGEKAGEPDQRRAFPEADDTEKEKENVIDSPEGGDKAEQNEKVQASSEKIAGPSNGHGAKRRLSISPIKQRTEESLNDGERPKVKEKRKEVTVVVPSPSEEKDLTKVESTREAELKREAKLKRKRIPNRRYSGPEWAYVVHDDWTDEFVSLSLENEEEEIPIEKKSFMDSVD